MPVVEHAWSIQPSNLGPHRVPFWVPDSAMKSLEWKKKTALRLQLLTDRGVWFANRHWVLMMWPTNMVVPRANGIEPTIWVSPTSKMRSSHTIAMISGNSTNKMWYLTTHDGLIDRKPMNSCRPLVPIWTIIRVWSLGPHLGWNSVTHRKACKLQSVFIPDVRDLEL